MSNNGQLAWEMIRSRRVLSALANCHVHGIYSVVLSERSSDVDGMLRVFYVDPTRRSEIGSLFTNQGGGIGDFSLLPHNHRQDITLHLLRGSARNVELDFAPGPGHITVEQYEFGSALLDGGFSLTWRRQESAAMSTQTILWTGTHLPAHVVHTVIARPGDMWAVKEGRLSDEPSLCYSRFSNKRLSNDGLYQPVTGQALSCLIEEMRASL